MAKIRKQGKIKTSSCQEWKTQSFVYFNLKDTFVILKVQKSHANLLRQRKFLPTPCKKKCPYTKCGGETIPRLFSGKLKLNISLDQWSQDLYSLFFLCSKLRAIARLPLFCEILVNMCIVIVC